MLIGGFGGPSGRRVRSVERALSASALLPTVAFAALGTLTILLVAQMGISPLGPVGAPSAHDGGQSVTTPRLSISIHPQRLHRSAPARDRETTTADAPTAPTAPTGPSTLTFARPVAHTNAPTRGRRTTTADAPTGRTSLTFARPVAHTIPPTRDRASTTPDAQSAAMTAAVTNAGVTNAAVIGRTVTNAAVTSWEVTTAAVEPQVQADTKALVASEVTYTSLGRAATAPALEPDDQRRPQNEGTSAKHVKPPQHTDAAQASEHAKAAKSRP
ncbi:MAG TPA: hypothetical protein VFF32_10575 [Dermatophilaceae bacterium]|nr:hypothetical protein [Dermatophilaceae bacterium]